MKSGDGHNKASLGTACFPEDDGKEALSEFLPPERDDKEELQRQIQLLFRDELARMFFDGFPDGGFILNDKRQIVAMNQAVRDRFKSFTNERILGLRPGEALGCEHAHDTPSGCGTTRFCRYCGAAHVMFQARMGKAAQEQCHVITEIEREALDLLVWGTPFKSGGRNFTLFAVADVSHEKRRQALERIFFHDVLNTVNGILGAAEILALKAGPDLGVWTQSVMDSGNILVREIEAQRQLLLAESGTLSVVNSKFLSNDLLKSVVRHCSQMSVSKGRNIMLHPDNQEFALYSDVSLLKRVLINLVKNALEASDKGGQVTLLSSQTEDYWVLSVHNRGYISFDDQHSLFKRSFSTKSAGRGLGLYSVRLLTVKYLKGMVSFDSDPKTGTVFEIILPKDGSNPTL